ncbi:MAG: hypothetical protein JAY74_09100, partial [Candidatus Thiodiazotropha taylori]|nr:hypothetical protein [Candidatus Thiodiazotropha taylori]
NSVPGLSAVLWKLRYPQAGQVFNTGVAQLTVTKIRNRECCTEVAPSGSNEPLSKSAWGLGFSMSIKRIGDSIEYSLFL